MDAALLPLPPTPYPQPTPYTLYCSPAGRLGLPSDSRCVSGACRNHRSPNIRPGMEDCARAPRRSARRRLRAAAKGRGTSLESKVSLESKLGRRRREPRRRMALGETFGRSLRGAGPTASASAHVPPSLGRTMGPVAHALPLARELRPLALNLAQPRLHPRGEAG